MFSITIIPGVGPQVEKGTSETSGEALVLDATRADLPTLEGPITTIWPAPSLEILYAEPWRLAPFLEPPEAFSLESLRRRSARRWSVPLCLGIFESISSSSSAFSDGSVAA